MDNSNIVSPPEVNMKGIRGGFWKQLGMLVLGTTVSLVLTFGTAQVIEKKQRANDRRLTALMVMSNIESFAQQLDTAWIQAAGADTAVAWLLNIPEDSLDEMTLSELLPIISKAKSIGFINYDKTTESIFSNNIDTWKNMGNFQFIDIVGTCFSTMRLCEEKWNGHQNVLSATFSEIAAHPDQYTGKTTSAKIARDPGFRQKLLMIHSPIHRQDDKCQDCPRPGFPPETTNDSQSAQMDLLPGQISALLQPEKHGNHRHHRAGIEGLYGETPTRNRYRPAGTDLQRNHHPQSRPRQSDSLLVKPYNYQSHLITKAR